MPLTVLVGLGNPLRGDDAVGLHVVEAVGRLLAARPVPDVRTVVGSRGGFELLDLLAGADRAVIVDCLDTPGGRPGRARTLSLPEVGGVSRLVGSHDVGLATAIDLGRLLGLSMPAEVAVVAIEADVGGRIEERLSPKLAAAVPRVARRIYRGLAGAGAPAGLGSRRGRTFRASLCPSSRDGRQAAGAKDGAAARASGARIPPSVPASRHPGEKSHAPCRHDSRRSDPGCGPAVLEAASRHRGTP